MPTLEWIGKEKVINHDKEVPFKLLEAQYTFDANGKREGTADSDNMIIHGDNLLALKALLPKYQGKIKCIYIDPPYNTGEENWIYNDNVNDPQIKKWLGEVVGKEGEDLSRHDKWLCMMYPRLKLLQKFLREDGVIFISIDDNELSNLKLMCDEIFGTMNFVASIPWRKRTAKSDVPFGISQDCETVLCYAKSNLFEAALEGHGRKYFETPDFPGQPWRYHDLTTQRTIEERPNSNFAMVNPKTGEAYPVNPLRSWAVTKETFKEFYDANKIIFPGDYDFINVSRPVMRYWKKDDYKDGEEEIHTVAMSTFLPQEIVGMTKDGTQEITDIFGSKVFNFPKPSSLIQFLIEVATYNDSDAIIMDSFAGSGTTAQAVLNVNLKDGGTRKFILVELSDYAETTTAERVGRVIKGYDKTGYVNLYEKKINLTNLKKGAALYEDALNVYEANKTIFDDVQKPKIVGNKLIVAAKNKDKTRVPGTGGSFTFYELGENLFDEEGNLNAAVPAEKIREYVWYMETKLPLPVPQREKENKLENKTESGAATQNVYADKMDRNIVNDNAAFLGVCNHTAYYFHYSPESATTLDHDFLSTIKTKAESYVIYADACALGEGFLTKHHITFKKIPRDIERL